MPLETPAGERAAAASRASKQGLEEVVLEIRDSMHGLGPSLRSLKVKRDKLLQHFRRRHTSDSVASVGVTTAVPGVTQPGTSSTNSAGSRASTIATDHDVDNSDRRKSSPPDHRYQVKEEDQEQEEEGTLSRLGCLASSHSHTHSSPSSTRTRRDSCYTFQGISPEDNRQVEDAAARTNTTLATTAEPPPSCTETAIESSSTPASPKFDEHSKHLPIPSTPLAVEEIPTPAVATPVPCTPTTSTQSQYFTPASTPVSPTPPRPTPPRRQSLFPQSEIRGIKESLLQDGITLSEETYESEVVLSLSQRRNIGMVNGKVWVRRREGSATLVDLREEDLVDNLKDAILKKYQNALARYYDAPDLQLRILPRGTASRPKEERPLAPDELVLKTLEDYYPGGQSVHEALVIDVPALRERERRTPRPSPNQFYSYYGHETFAVPEGNEYFPLMPPNPPPHPTSHSSSNLNSSQPTLVQPAMSVLTAGQVPSVPGSPGTRGLRSRPGLRNRMHTTSAAITNPAPSGSGTPVLLVPKARTTRVSNSEPPSSIQSQPPIAPPISTPPIAEEVPPPAPIPTSPPPVRVASPRPKKQKPKTGLIEGTVPPINVLIVEDNSINLKLLEAFMKRLKVRWQSAMNGQEAVNKWRAGGFHLVLMDIHLPVMNGLEATKEIRRLEKVNGIGVFSPTPASDGDESPEVKEIPEEDKLSSTFLFKSPVIIVALTASSLQSDRHEALAAGCNDFLTKPVNNLWLEKKLTEWGCMQALIDFDGWKKWKDISAREAEELEKRKRQGGGKRERQRSGGLLGSTMASSSTAGINGESNAITVG